MESLLDRFYLNNQMLQESRYKIPNNTTAWRIVVLNTEFKVIVKFTYIIKR